MRKLFIVLMVPVLVMGVLLTALLASAASEPPHEAEEVSREAPRLTIYQGATTLVRDTRTFALEEGRNRVVFSGVSNNLDVNSVAVTGERVVVLRRAFTPAREFSLDELLQANVGEEVTLVTEEEATLSGTLLSARPPTVQQADGVVVTAGSSAIVSYDVPVVPPASAPQIELIVDSTQAGEQPLEVTYLTGGMSWAMQYTFVLAADNESLELAGWLSIGNGTRVAYEGATLTLASGSIAGVQFVGRDTEIAAVATATALATPTLPPTGGGGGGVGGGYTPPDFEYTLPDPVDLAPGQTGLDILAGGSTEARNRYVYDASPRVFGYRGFITTPDYSVTDITAVQNFLSFSARNVQDEEIPLPGGRAVLYRETVEGPLELIARIEMPYTPAGETVEIYLENEGTLTGERVQTEFLELSQDAVQETFEITLTNAGDTAVTVEVPERLTRSSNWEVLGANAPYEETEDFGIAFTVPLEPGQTDTIVYTVLYTRP